MKVLSKLSCFPLTLCLILSSVSPGEAQSGRVKQGTKTQQDKDDKDTIRLRVEEVLLPVSIRSTNGKLPSRLKPDDFMVSEDGKRQKVNSVMRSPANILFVLDAGGSPAYKNTNLNRDLAIKLLKSLDEEDQAAVIAYADRPRLLASWTSDRDELRHAMNWDFRPGLKSAFYSALLFAAEKVLPDVEGRRSVVICTDGIDTYEGPAFEEALKALHRARATVYVASHTTMLLRDIKPLAFNKLSWYERLDPAGRKKIDRLRAYYRKLEWAEALLRRLAEETGGALWTPEAAELFTEVSTRVVSEINTEYLIAYLSERPSDDKAFHEIKVFSSIPDVQIRARRGIYPNENNGT
jgi:VWFA-related protein